MALGEHVSVSTQRDTERALIVKEQAELRDMPTEEFDELVGLYRDKGPSPRRPPIRSRPNSPTTTPSPLTPRSSWASIPTRSPTRGTPRRRRRCRSRSARCYRWWRSWSFPQHLRIPLTFVVVRLALALTGWLSARIGDADVRRAILRVTIGGALAMAITYVIGLATGHRRLKKVG